MLLNLRNQILEKMVTKLVKKEQEEVPKVSFYFSVNEIEFSLFAWPDETWVMSAMKEEGSRLMKIETQKISEFYSELKDLIERYEI